MSQYEVLTIILTVVSMIEIGFISFGVGYTTGLKKGFMIGIRKEK